MGRRIEEAVFGLQPHLEVTAEKAIAHLRRKKTTMENSTLSPQEVFFHAKDPATLEAIDSLLVNAHILNELGLDDFTADELHKLNQRFSRRGELTLEDLAIALTNRIATSFDSETNTAQLANQAVENIRELAKEFRAKGFSISLETLAPSLLEELIGQAIETKKTLLEELSAYKEQEASNEKYFSDAVPWAIRKLMELDDQGCFVNWRQSDIAEGMLCSAEPSMEELKSASDYLSVVKVDFIDFYLKRFDPSLPLEESITEEFLSKRDARYQELFLEIKNTWGYLTPEQFKITFLNRFSKTLIPGWTRYEGTLEDLREMGIQSGTEYRLGVDYRFVPGGIHLAPTETEYDLEEELALMEQYKHQDSVEALYLAFDLDEETGDFLYKTVETAAEKIPTRSWRADNTNLFNSAKKNFLNKLKKLLPEHATENDVLIEELLSEEFISASNPDYIPLYKDIRKRYGKLTLQEFKYAVVQNFAYREKQIWQILIDNKEEIEAITTLLGPGSHYRINKQSVDKRGNVQVQELLLTPEAGYLVNVARKHLPEDKRSAGNFLLKLEYAIETQRKLYREVAHFETRKLTWDGNREATAALQYNSFLKYTNSYFDKEKEGTSCNSVEELAQELGIMDMDFEASLTEWLNVLIYSDAYDEDKAGLRHTIIEDNDDESVVQTKIENKGRGQKEAEKVIKLMIRVVGSRNLDLIAELEAKIADDPDFDKYSYLLFFSIIKEIGNNPWALSVIEAEMREYFRSLS